MTKDYSEIFTEEFLKLAKEKEYTKISIVNLTERCSTSRQTFYYYYKSIGDMVIKSVDREIGEICSSVTEKDSWYESASRVIKVIEKYQYVIKSALESKKSLLAIDLISTNIEQFIRAFVKAKHREDRFSEFLYTCCKYTFTGLIISEIKNENPNLMNILNKIDARLIKE